MKSDPPIISIVTPSFNQGRFIRKTIESVLEQQGVHLEHIVVDGGSTDETVSILKSFRHLTWISEPDRGQADALNKGIALARGAWIGWINSDDYLLPGALQKLLAYIQGHPGSRFVYSNCTFVDTQDAIIGKRRARYNPRSFPYWWRRGGAGFAQPGTFFIKSLWHEFGPFDAQLQYMMDYDFWLKIHAAVRFDYLDDDLATYRLHQASKTSLGWRPFVEEGMAISRRYWDRRGALQRWKFRLLLNGMHGTQLMLEAMRSQERGEHAGALWKLAWARNPLALFSFTHLRFRLRQMTGPRAYAQLSRKFPSLQRLFDVFNEKEYHKL